MAKKSRKRGRPPKAPYDAAKIANLRQQLVWHLNLLDALASGMKSTKTPKLEVNFQVQDALDEVMNFFMDAFKKLREESSPSDPREWDLLARPSATTDGEA